MWQDYVISIIGVSFAFMLIPQLSWSLKGRHVNKWSSGLTALGLYILSGTLLTLGLYLACLGNLASALMWTTIFFLSIIK